MTTNADLAIWGEPPATPEEETLAGVVHELLETVERGSAGRSSELLRGSPDRVPHGDELAQTMAWVQDLAASVWHHSELPVTTGAERPAAEGNLPDPFPGEFRILALLGEGAFGKAWLAEDLFLDRRVALKELKPPGSVDRLALETLRREARLLDSVRHPNIVQVHAMRQSGRDYYLVLQYVAGGSLAARLQKEGPLRWQQAARYVADVAEALLQVHACGIVHRDINPANILWDPAKDEAILTDFGISCRLAERAMVAAGTLAYMAPEAFGGEVTPALDLFGLAASLFRLVTGEVPFQAHDIVEHVEKVMAGLPDPDTRCKDLPPPLERLIRAALAPAAQERPGLPEFVQTLRGTLNRLLADSMLLPIINAPEAAPVNLRLLVSREHDPSACVSLSPAQSQTAWAARDLTKVPPAPERIRLRTGDRLRIQVSTDQAGYVTVFNIGPTGNLHLLCPDEPTGASMPLFLGANRPLDVWNVQLTPPAGRERLIATWSRTPLALPKLVTLAGQAGDAVSRPYRATRDIERVQESMQKLRREDWHVVVLELDHET